MAQTQISGQRVRVQLKDGESVSVPSGETWFVHVVKGDGAEVTVNGVTTWNNGSSSNYYSDQKTLFNAGDTIANNQNNSSSTVLAGYRVDSSVTYSITDTPVSEQIGSGGSLTVPTGEVWDVHLLMGDGTDLRLNSSMIKGNAADSWEQMTLTLEGGDSLNEAGNNGRGVHIGGFNIA